MSIKSLIDFRTLDTILYLIFMAKSWLRMFADKEEDESIYDLVIRCKLFMQHDINQIAL